MSGIVTIPDLYNSLGLYLIYTLMHSHLVCEEVVLEALNQVPWDLINIPALAPDSVVFQYSDDFIICLALINHEKTTHNYYVHNDVRTGYLSLGKDADVQWVHIAVGKIRNFCTTFTAKCPRNKTVEGWW
jgi:hypothetical protein